MLGENQGPVLQAYAKHHLMPLKVAETIYRRSTYDERANVVEAFKRGVYTDNEELIDDLRDEVSELKHEFPDAKADSKAAVKKALKKLVMWIAIVSVVGVGLWFCWVHYYG